MCDEHNTTRFRVWRWLIRFIGVIVPRRFRARFRQEWEAELEYREELLSRWERLDWRNKFALLWRSLGAFWDALWLQQLRWEDEMIQDLRFGFRMLLKNPGFTSIAVLTLALGIGANTAIFTLLDKVLIRSLPVERPQQLVTFVEDAGGAAAIFSYPLYADLRARNQDLSGLVAYCQQPFSLTDGSRSERVVAQIVSGNYFDVLGVRPALGRFFLPEEDRTPGTHPVVVIGYGLWQRRFGADPAVIGKTLSLNGYRYTIVGVAPSEFTGTTRGTANDVYLPIMMQVQTGLGRSGALNSRDWGWLQLIGRLKPGVSREQAQAALTLLAEPSTGDKLAGNSEKEILLLDGSRGYTDRVDDLSLPLKLLLGMVGLVLLIACANVANLLLSRASVRRREIAIRLAVGAGRLRIVRQLLVESAILAALGGCTGLLVARWLTGLLLGFQPQTSYIPRTFDGHLDGNALGFTLCLSLLTGIVFGLAPALQASKPDFVAALKGEMPESGRGARRLNLRSLLVVVQVALSLIVLIGAGLCVKSLRALQAIDPGFEPAKVLTASFDLSQSGYDEARGVQFVAQISERVAGLPGVEAVSLALNVAFNQSHWVGGAIPEGYQGQAGKLLAFDFNPISPDYFRTLGARLVSGREFTAQDTRDAPLVAMINEATARRYWPGQDAIGKRIILGGGRLVEIVGVVRDSRERGLIVEPCPALFFPLLQNYVPQLTLHVRTAMPAQTLPAVRREFHVLDPALPVYNLGTLAQQKDGSLYTERLAAVLLALFGLLALLLAAIGIYGVLSYAVTERTREMGIRLALGAHPRDLLRLVVGQGMVLTFIGLIIGAVAAFTLTRLIARFLYGVSATDPLTFMLIPLVLACVALFACWLPARRAMRVDPLEALRSE